MQIFEYLRKIALLCCILLANAASASQNSVELLMIEEPGCVYCGKFNREIAPAYPKTTEGAIAPLRRVQLYEPWPQELEHIEKPRYTPTFILISEGKEIDRLLGYPGDDHFWFLLGEMLEKL